MDEFVCPSIDHIVRINHTLVGRYGGAAHHLRDGGPLSNALNVVQNPVYGVDLFPTVEEKAAKLAHAIATGHVFADGNKKTAASVLDLVLNLNGSILLVPQDELVEMMIDLANGPAGVTLETFTGWVRQHVAKAPG